MTATSEVDGKKIAYDGEQWKPAWKVPWREVYCATRWGWLKETAWCLLIINAIQATATGRRWARKRTA